jgi:hypothetical protein
MADMKYKINYCSATLNYQKSSLEGFLFSAQKTKVFNSQYVVIRLDESAIVLNNVHEQGK